MFILKANEIEIELSGMKIFENGNLEINEGERVALIGENGIGKTSFINALMGRIPISKGSLQLQFTNEEIGWFLTDEIESNLITAREVVESTDGNLSSLKKKIENSSQNLADEQILQKYNDCLSEYIDLNGYDWEMQIEQLLKKFQLPQSTWDLPFSQLSGGQKTKVKLAKIMVNQPKLLSTLR